jgi:arabinogalactan endo-1,4-beta-galactosidase
MNDRATPRRGAILAAILGIALLPAASSAQSRTPDVFYLGADISALAGTRRPVTPPDSATTSASAPVASGRARRAAFVYRENGVETTEYAIMLEHGWNAFRLRVFVSPVRNAPNNSLENTLPLAKAIRDAGGTFMLDIHYSDTWADPGHQETPLAWRDLDAAGMEKQVEEYTREVISQFRAAGAMPDMVQVGNEITAGLLWPLGRLRVPSSEVRRGGGDEPERGAYLEPYDEARAWENVTRFLKAGIRGVKAGSGSMQPKIILHTDTGADWQVTRWWFDHITAAQVEYDIMGLSFYPKYHGTLAMLQQNMIESQRRYHKPFMVVETGYVQNDTSAMSPPEAIARPVLSAKTPKERGFMQWPGTPGGQLQFMADLVNTVQRNHGLGVFYWGPEGSWGDGMWLPDGSAAPSIHVLDHLEELKAGPASRLPAAAEPPRSAP